MISITAFCALFMGSASPKTDTPSLDPTKCAADDLRCSARGHAASAKRTKSREGRAAAYFSAHRAYLALFDEEHNSSDLCLASTYLDKVRTLRPQQLGPRLADSAKATKARLRTARVTCEIRSTTPTPRATTTSVAVEPEPAAAPATVTPLVGVATPSSPAAPSPTRTSATNGLASATPWVPPTRPDVSVAPGVSSKAQPPPGQPGRPLRVAGGISLGGGLLLGGFAAILGARAVDLRRTGWELAVDAEPGTPSRYADDARRAEYERLGTSAVVVGALGGAAVFVGAILLATGLGRQRATQARVPTLLPVAGGVVFKARF